MRNNLFEIIGYSVDYYVDGKFKGSTNLEKPDREEMGYVGRKRFTLSTDMTLKNRKVIKAGTEVVTELNQINGKVLNKPVFMKKNVKKD